MRHFISLGGYNALNAAEGAVDRALEKSATKQYDANRWVDALKYGSGGDY